MACTMCPHPSFGKRDKGHMDMSLFTSVIDKISPYAEIIKLHWIGEPLMHPQIVDMVRYARKNTVAKLYMATNASLLCGELADGIRTSGLDKLIITIDGDSAESYEKIRIRGKFEIVRNNVENFLRSVERSGGPTCHIKLIQQFENQSDVDGFRARWSRFPPAMVEVMWLSDWAGNVRDSRLHSSQLNPNIGIDRSACSDLWFKMQVDWRGNVALCCFDAFGTENFGNLGTQTLEEVWHCEAIVAHRIRHLAKSCKGICARCRDWAAPEEYEFWYEDKDLQKDPSSIWLKHRMATKEETSDQ
jgi:MoaA/NifB/PqqE/SkfB family radical SAM enzyme